MSKGGARPGAGRPKTPTTRIMPRIRNDSLFWLEEARKKSGQNIGDIISDIIDASDLRPQIYKDFKGAGQLLKELPETPPSV